MLYFMMQVGTIHTIHSVCKTVKEGITLFYSTMCSMYGVLVLDWVCLVISCF